MTKKAGGRQYYLSEPDRLLQARWEGRLQEKSERDSFDGQPQHTLAIDQFLDRLKVAILTKPRRGTGAWAAPSIDDAEWAARKIIWDVVRFCQSTPSRDGATNGHSETVVINRELRRLSRTLGIAVRRIEDLSSPTKAYLEDALHLRHEAELRRFGRRSMASVKNDLAQRLGRIADEVREISAEFADLVPSVKNLDFHADTLLSDTSKTWYYVTGFWPPTTKSKSSRQNIRSQKKSQLSVSQDQLRPGSILFRLIEEMVESHAPKRLHYVADKTFRDVVKRVKAEASLRAATPIIKPVKRARTKG